MAERPSGSGTSSTGGSLIPVNPASGSAISFRSNGGMAQGIPPGGNTTPDCRRLSTPPINYVAAGLQRPHAPRRRGRSSPCRAIPPAAPQAEHGRRHEGRLAPTAPPHWTTGFGLGSAVYKKIPSGSTPRKRIRYTSQKVGGRHYPRRSTTPPTVTPTRRWPWCRSPPAPTPTLTTASRWSPDHRHANRRNCSWIRRPASMGNRESDIGRCFGIGGHQGRLVIVGGCRTGNATAGTVCRQEMAAPLTCAPSSSPA